MTFLYSLKATFRACTLVCLLTAANLMPAYAHGIAGNRFFPGSLTFDDPAVADEFSISTGVAENAVDGLYATNNASTLSVVRLLTPTISIGIDTGYLRRNWNGVHQSGATGTDLVLKTRLYEDDQNETLVAGSLAYTFAGSGSRQIGANTPSSLGPSLYVGQGFGALPESLAWLRPFGITGGVSVAVPTSGSSSNLKYNLALKQYVDVQTPAVAAVHWGFAIEYSTLYLTERFQPGVLPKEEPLHQFVPLVEFAFDSLRGQKTTGTANPGIAYVKDTWQFAAEAVLPLNRESGRGVGAQVQLLFFMDDFLPSVFGRPLLAK